MTAILQNDGQNARGMTAILLKDGLFFLFTPSCPHPFCSSVRVYYADPVASMISVLILLVSAWPLVKSTSWILMQASPGFIDLDE